MELKLRNLTSHAKQKSILAKTFTNTIIINMSFDVKDRKDCMCVIANLDFYDCHTFRVTVVPAVLFSMLT